MTWESHPVTCRRVWRTLLVPVALVFTVNCTIVHRVDISPLPRGVSATIATPVRAHLTDGSTVIFADGVSVTADAIEGQIANAVIRASVDFDGAVVASDGAVAINVTK